MLVVHPSLPVKSVKDLIALAKARPGELNCGSSGNGSGSHLALELFNRMAGVRIMRIPYNGDGPAIIDLLGGQVPVKFDNLSTSLPHVRAGKLRPLGVTSPVRTALLPEVPAISETVPGFQASIFNGMMAPAGTPPEILARVHAEIVKFVQAPEIRGALREAGGRAPGERSRRAVHRLHQDRVRPVGQGDGRGRDQTGVRREASRSDKAVINAIVLLHAHRVCCVSVR